ncbi:MAG TPA: ROK family protein [Gammaproteobacteria bacterium]|nr:ROK family protein [Gammaproteobacteria bacterium]
MPHGAKGGHIYGAIEGGGTKFVCAVATAPDRILERVSVPTAEPPVTLAECVRFFAAAERTHGKIAAFGIGCFGPIELDASRANYGCMLPTPKPGWTGADVLAPLRAAFDAPIALDTDVAAAAAAEWRLGAGRGAGSLAYVTVGTGIGGAVVPRAAGRRLMHAEMGHLPLRRDARDAGFAGVCPFHGDCAEGLASGPAIRARWGSTLDALPADHFGRALIAGYVGQLAAAIALLASVERIVIGGGVMGGGALVPLVRAAALDYLNGYLAPLNDPQRAAGYICAPALGGDAGVVGALLLAADAS